MKDPLKEIDFIQLAKDVWKKRKTVIKWVVGGFVIGLVVAFSIPKTYRTTVQIAPEGSSKQVGSLGGLASIAGIDMGRGMVEDGVSERLYPQIISSTPFLLEFADIKVDHKDRSISFYQYISEEQQSPWWSVLLGLPSKMMEWVVGLFDDDAEKADNNVIDIFRPSEKQNRYIRKLHKLITAESDKKSGIITLNISMQDPLIAAIIADSTIAQLQRYMIHYRTSKISADLEQNIRMYNEAKTDYYRADSIYASHVDRNLNVSTRSALLKLERLANEKTLAYSVYQQTAMQVATTKVKLQEETPIATVIEPAKVATTAEPPRKLFLVLAFVFLGGFLAVTWIVSSQVVGFADRG